MAQEDACLKKDKPVEVKPEDPKTPVEGEKPATDAVKLLKEGEVCTTSDECSEDFACLMVHNKTATVKEEMVKFLCVQDNRKGCVVGMRNVLEVANRKYVSIMANCLPRMESLDAASALTKE